VATATLTKFVDRSTESRLTKSSKIEHALSWPTKSGDFVSQQNRAIVAFHTTDFCPAILSADKIGQFCRSSDIPLRFVKHFDVSWVFSCVVFQWLYSEAGGCWIQGAATLQWTWGTSVECCATPRRTSYREYTSATSTTMMTTTNAVVLLRLLVVVVAVVTMM